MLIWLPIPIGHLLGKAARRLHRQALLVNNGAARHLKHKRQQDNGPGVEKF